MSKKESKKTKSLLKKKFKYNKLEYTVVEENDYEFISETMVEQGDTKYPQRVAFPMSIFDIVKQLTE